MKVKKFQRPGNNSVCAGAFQLLRGRAPAQLGGNIARPPIQRVPVAVSLSIKRPRRGADNPPPFNGKARNSWNYTGLYWRDVKPLKGQYLCQLAG
jgi:hypothetical protein